MSIERRIFAFTNGQNQDLLLIVEPWAEQYMLEPGMTIEIVGIGGDPSDHFEISLQPDAIVVYGWAGSIVSVLHNGSELGPTDQI